MKRFLDLLRQLKSKNSNVYNELVSCWVDLTTEQREIVINKHVKSLDRSIKKTKVYFVIKNFFI